MNYEYLKPFFEGGPLSFEQLTEKLDAADGVKLANLKDGGYVGKDKFDALEARANGLQAQLSEANGKLEGYDPEWKAKAQQMQQEANQKVEAVRFDYALKAALTAAKAKNPELVAKSINRDALKLTDAGLVGLEEQLKALKESDGYLFEGDKPYSVCPNMTTDRQDFVSAYYIFSAFPRADGVSAYDHFLACCEKLGIPDVPERLQQMMILDYLICNQDRHFGNFGAIRDAVTLEWVGFAPIFDSGTSLWFDQYASKIDALADAPAKPFAATQQAQLALARDGLPALNLAALDDCKDEVLAIFEQAHFGEPNRANILVDALAVRCKILQAKQ